MNPEHFRINTHALRMAEIIPIIGDKIRIEFVKSKNKQIADLIIKNVHTALKRKPVHIHEHTDHGIYQYEHITGYGTDELNIFYIECYGKKYLGNI